MKSKDIHFIEFIFLVALLMALVSATINMLLPAFQKMSIDFQLKDKNQIQLSISLLYLGLGISQALYGVISDSIGRKPTIYFGLVLFIIGCMISWLSSSIETLLIGQILQGVGLGAPRVISVAIVRDQYEGVRMARAMSFIMVIYVLTPTISPILGKSIINLLNWRTLFIVYICFGMFLFLLFKYRMPETLRLEKRRKFSVQQLKQAIIEIFKNQKSLGYTIILGLYSGVFITYLNLSQAIFEFQYNLGEQYPYYFSFLALSIGLASFTNGKLVNRLGMEIMTQAAIVFSIGSAIVILTINHFIMLPFWMFVIFMFIQLFSYGLLIGNINALAMEPLGHIAGLGASIVGAISTLISVPLSILIGSFYSNNTFPIIIGFLAVGILSLLIVHYTKYIFEYGKQYHQQSI